MYADDAVIFIRPAKRRSTSWRTCCIIFGEVTGLHTNISKSSVIPIHCRGLDLNQILSHFPAKLTSFPIRYLGLPLSATRLRKVDFQPLADKAAGSLLGWRGRNLTNAGRVTLTKTVLSSQPVYLLTVLLRRFYRPLMVTGSASCGPEMRA
jgi:hypothetical protein